MKHLKDNQYLRKIDTRVVTLCLFPYDLKYIRENLEREYLSEKRYAQLFRDAKELLKTLRNDPQYKALFAQVMRHIGVVKKARPRRETTESIAALLYFLNPYDDVHDRIPIRGMSDDLGKLISANRERKTRVSAAVSR